MGKRKNLPNFIFILLLIILSFIFILRKNNTTTQPKSFNWEERFEEIWQICNENFYDPSFKGINWTNIKYQYLPLIKKARSEDEFALLINKMLSELNTSHTHFYSKNDKEYFELMDLFQEVYSQEIEKFFPNKSITYPDIGIFTKEIGNKVFIKGILEGSVAYKAKLLVGDQIISVDGERYHPIKSFLNKVGQKVTIKIQRRKDPNSQKNIKLIPVMVSPNKRFLEATKTSARIIKKSHYKIGYIHMWSFAGEEYYELLKEEIAVGKFSKADALIIDLRDGWGGANPDYLNLFNRNIPIITFISRDKTKSIYDTQWRKPVVFLINEGTRSGKEILAYGVKKYNIGKLIGMRTAGAVCGGQPFILSDGSLLYLAVSDSLVNGIRLEGIGVEPDIEVPFPLEYSKGKDPQIEKAIDILITQIKEKKVSEK